MTDKVQKIRDFLDGMANEDCVSTNVRKAIEKKMLPFIDSMQGEPVIKNLEEAARRYAALQAGMKDAMTSKYYEEYPYSPNDIEAFKAGAQWGKDQAKVEIQAQSIALAHGCPKEPVSEEFEKALAEEWKGYTERGAATVDVLEDNTQELAFAKGFYRGSKWQKEQMMAKAVDAKLLEGHLIRQKEVTHPLHVGDKVKVIVIKEDEL